MARLPTPRDRQVGGTHYTEKRVQPWDVVDTWPREQRIGYYRGNALKYAMRFGSKDPLRNGREDAEKAVHYLQKLLSTLDED